MSLAERVRVAVVDVRLKYRDAEQVRPGEVSRLILDLRALAPSMLKEAAEGSDGLLRFSQGKFGSYQNDHLMLRLQRPDRRVYSLHVVFIHQERVACYIKDGAEPSYGTQRWLNLEELREPEAFLEARIFELISYYARDVGSSVTF